MLAYHIYPPPRGREISVEELNTENGVCSLFDACQILEAIITTEGWEYLIDTYGIERLFELDCESGWHDESCIEAYISSMCAEPEFLEGYTAVMRRGK